MEKPKTQMPLQAEAGRGESVQRDEAQGPASEGRIRLAQMKAFKAKKPPSARTSKKSRELYRPWPKISSPYPPGSLQWEDDLMTKALHAALKEDE